GDRLDREAARSRDRGAGDRDERLHGRRRRRARRERRRLRGAAEAGEPGAAVHPAQGVHLPEPRGLDRRGQRGAGGERRRCPARGGPGRRRAAERQRSPLEALLATRGAGRSAAAGFERGRGGPAALRSRSEPADPVRHGLSRGGGGTAERDRVRAAVARPGAPLSAQAIRPLGAGRARAPDRHPRRPMKARILVVDDNAELAENVCEILEGIDGFDVECHTASDRSTAMAACGAANHDLDLALVDLRLPDGDGLGLVADLREGCRFVEVVIITGDATLESAISAVEQGAFAYVLKPFRPAELLRTAHSALDKVRAVRELEQARAGLELSERRHRELVEAVPAFVLSLDAEGRIALWNDQLERVTGFRRAEMLGKPGRDLVADGDRRLPLKKGGHRMVRWKCAAVSGPDQQPVTYALGTDVTE